MMIKTITDFLNALFDRSKWKDVTVKQKEEYFFITMRFLTIKFPQEINTYNRKNINKSATLDLWNLMLTNKFKPGNFKWCFRSIKDISKTSITGIKNDVIKEYMIDNELKQDDYLFLYHNLNSELIEDIKMYNKILNQQNG